MSKESPAERRIDTLGRNVFDRAVAEAAQIATQRVAAIHRVRLVTQAFLAAVVVSSSLALLLAFVFKAQIADENQRRAVANCRLIQSLERPLGDFVRTDADLRAALGLHALTGVDARSALLNAQTTDYWLTSVVPRLNAISAVECSRR